MRWAATLKRRELCLDDALALPPTILFGMAIGEFESTKLIETFTKLSPGQIGVLAFSCITGTAIGYAGWYCRGLVSATTYTVVGVVNKFATIVLNVLIWDKHASANGLAALLVCLLAGTFYKQAPRRGERAGGK